jgi:hypothetical protein
MFVVHLSLKNALERQQGKRTPVNAIATQGFEDRKNHSPLTTRSSNPSNAGLQFVTTKTEG